MNRDAEVSGVVRIAGAPVCVCVCVYVKEESIFNENTFNLTNLMIINERNSQEDLYAFAFDDSFRASDDQMAVSSAPTYKLYSSLCT